MGLNQPLQQQKADVSTEHCSVQETSRNEARWTVVLRLHTWRNEVLVLLCLQSHLGMRSRNEQKQLPGKVSSGSHCGGCSTDFFQTATQCLPLKVCYDSSRYIQFILTIDKEIYPKWLIGHKEIWKLPVQTFHWIISSTASHKSAILDHGGTWYQGFIRNIFSSITNGVHTSGN